jgi:hypothetical protein
LADEDDDLRQFDPELLLTSRKVAEVLRGAEEMMRTYASMGGFGFVFGGFAKGYATSEHDIDMFLCLETVDDCTREQIRSDYFALHHYHGLPPDEKDPCELMTVLELAVKLKISSDRPLRPVIETYEEYEAICWTEILTRAVAAFVGSHRLFGDLRGSVAHVPQRWRRELFAMLPKPLDPKDARLSTLRLMKLARRTGHMRYAKKR